VDPNPKNPKVLVASESEKKNSDSGPDTCYKIKIIPKNQGLNTHLKENKMYVFVCYSKTFFLFYRFRKTYERNESHYLENCYVKILVLESESENGKKILDPNPIKNISDQQHWHR
jgi:hypothetical protein